MCTLQMQVQWESNINFRFQFMYSQKWNCAALLFPKQNYNVLSPNFYCYVSVNDLYIPKIGLLIWLNVETREKAAEFHFWEKINRISVQCMGLKMSPNMQDPYNVSGLTVWDCNLQYSS